MEGWMSKWECSHEIKFLASSRKEFGEEAGRIRKESGNLFKQVYALRGRAGRQVRSCCPGFLWQAG